VLASPLHVVDALLGRFHGELRDVGVIPLEDLCPTSKPGHVFCRGKEIPPVLVDLLFGPEDVSPDLVPGLLALIPVQMVDRNAFKPVGRLLKIGPHLPLQGINAVVGRLRQGVIGPLKRRIHRPIQLLDDQVGEPIPEKRVRGSGVHNADRFVVGRRPGNVGTYGDAERSREAATQPSVSPRYRGAAGSSNAALMR